MFSNFTNEEGNLKEAVIISDDDREGILSLYEAAHFRVHGEDVLEKALSFSAAKLRSMANNDPTSFFTAQVNHAMRFPIRKAHPRIDTRFYISTYEQKRSHNSCLLRFSKLDFNMVQKQHQMELNQVSRYIFAASFPPNIKHLSVYRD